MAEFFDSSFHASASSPNVIEQNISSIGVNFEFMVDRISIVGLDEASFAVGADLNGFLVPNKNFLDFMVAEFGKVLSD